MGITSDSYQSLIGHYRALIAGNKKLIVEKRAKRADRARQDIERLEAVNAELLVVIDALTIDAARDARRSTR